ncbi:50S ribosomal protein L4 [candidate division KSB1 bacterium]|nr:MAG: 50S ribosomal protein L4 [candidate division KSB1 bacterium]
MEFSVYKIDGTVSEEKVVIRDDIVNIKPNDSAIYLAVKSYLAAQRQGTSATKNRSLRRGGGAKPYRQKGTGRSRAGTIRSPIWRGGGRVFGPVPHKYNIKVNKKVKKLARRSAFVYKIKENKVKITESFDFEKPRTKDMLNILRNLGGDERKIALLTGKDSENLFKSGRNIPDFQLYNASRISTYNILNSELLLIQKDAVDIINRIF